VSTRDACNSNEAGRVPSCWFNRHNHSVSVLLSTTTILTWWWI
jgi:hypothetical protein